jgi:hypothetical protein
MEDIAKLDSVPQQEARSDSVPRQPDEPSAERWKHREQLFEALAVISLAFSVGMIWLDFGWAWLALFVALAFAACAFAIWYSYMADKADQKASGKAIYKVTRLRIETLREKGIMEDVRDSLDDLVGEGFINADQLINKLQEDLGPARAHEVQEVVLKYTRYKDSPEN